jgi:hypothetical protein
MLNPPPPLQAGKGKTSRLPADNIRTFRKTAERCGSLSFGNANFKTKGVPAPAELFGGPVGDVLATVGAVFGMGVKGETLGVAPTAYGWYMPPLPFFPSFFPCLQYEKLPLEAFLPFATVNGAFEELLKRIELDPTRVAVASQRYNSVKATIEGALPGKTVSQVGSFQRKTKIRPADLGDGLDIDAVVNFKRFTQYGTGSGGISPAQALETVRSALVSNMTYRVMSPVKDHPTVCLKYADGMSLELIPAFADGTGTYPHPGLGIDCYVIGTSAGIWTSADYDYDAAMISSLNGMAKDKLVPAIKLIKAYFRSATIPLKSFHTEILAANIVPSTIIEWEKKGYEYGYHHILASFLAQASKIATIPVALSGSYSKPLDSDLSQATLATIGTFLASRAEVAWTLCADKFVTSALVGWRAFFGEPFPA